MVQITLTGHRICTDRSAKSRDSSSELPVMMMVRVWLVTWNALIQHNTIYNIDWTFSLEFGSPASASRAPSTPTRRGW
jgi:hypothetical protein